jgi:outer membrane protein insertion porin family
MVRLAIALVLLLLVVFAGSALFLASSEGKALVLRTLSASLRSELGVEARAAGLEYRPSSLGFTLHAVNITQSTAARPFLTAERVDVDVSAAIFLGRLVLRRFAVSRPEIVLDSTTQGASAVPAAGREGQAHKRSTTVPSIDIRDGRVSDLALTAVSPDGMHVALRGLSLSFTGEGPGVLRGALVVSGGGSVRRGTAEIGFDRGTADVSLAGTSLALTSIAMESPVAAIRGTVYLDVSRGDLDVTYRARVALGQLQQWLTAVPPLGGELEASGTVRGTLGHPVASFDGRVKRLQWQEVTDAGVSVTGRWSGTDLTIDRYSASSRTMGANLDGSARLVVGDREGSSSLRVEASVENARRLAPVTGTFALPAAPVTLVADLTWPGLVLGPESLTGRIQMAVLNAAAPGATIATVDATGERRRWTVHSRGALEGDTSLAGDFSVILDRASLLQSTLTGRFGAQTAKLEDAVRDLRRQGLLPADLEAVLQGGRAAADATLTGTLASPRLEASLTADSLTLGGVEQVRGEAQVRLEGRAVEITRMTAEASGNRVDVHGTATAGSGPIHLAVDARLDRPEVFAAALPAEWRPAGSLAVSGTLDGSPANPRLAARISGSGLEANGIAVDSLEGDVTFEHGVLNVTGLRLNRGGGWLRLEANIDRRLERMRVSGRGEKLAVSAAEALHLDDASVEFDVAGSPGQPTGTFSMVAGDVAINGRALGRVELTARSADQAVRFGLGLPTLSAEVSGRIGFDPGWPFEARANLRRSQLTSLAALLERTIVLPDTSATVTASAEVKGQLNRPLESTGVITVPEIEGQLRGKPLRLIQPGRIRFDERRPTVEEPLQIAVGGFSMGLARIRDRENGVMITVEGRIEDGIAFVPPDMLITPWLVEGPVRAQVSLDREGDRFAIAGDVDATIDTLMRAEGELARGVHLQAGIRGRAIEFSATDGVVLGAPFSATARMPLAWAVPVWLADGAAARGDISPIEGTISARSDAMLAPALQALGIKNTNMSGAATVAIEAHAAEPRLDKVVATATLEAAEVSVDDLGLIQQTPTRLRLDRGRLEVGALDWKGPHSFLTASGAIGLLPGTEGEFRAEGTTSLAFLRMMAPGIGGEAAFQVRVAGPPGARAASAKVDLNDVNIIEPDWQLALAGLSGPLTLEAGVLDTRGLRGQLNGGDLTIEGAVPVRAGTVAPRPLNIEARGLFVEIPKGLRSQLDARLTWENAGAGPRLSGQITIASDSYREPITALAPAISALTPGRAPPLPVPPWITATALDIRLNSVGPIVVDQSALNLELVPDVRVTGTVGRPALDGQVTIQDDGRIRVGGRSYRLTESRLEFSPASGLLPRLSLIGETHVSSYLVTLRMAGPADQIETNFSSDPPLSERDVRSLLVTGQVADPARGTTDSDTFAVGAVSGDVLGVAGQFVGLDTVSVGTEDLDLVSSDVDPATRLTVSKRLGTKFELVLSENLEENESTWIVIYRPVSGYEFRLSSNENTKQALEFRQEITFGSGVAPRTRVRAATVVQDRIRSVALAGEPGFGVEQVLSGTKLRQGDRFEFRAWLEDRDRIVQYYWDREYYTARVVPMRTSAESTGKERPVDLQYRIARGRRTVLEITGYAGGDDLLNRLRQTWSGNVVLDLLNDRLATATREHLIDAGFLRARIEVEVDRPDSDTDRARVRIDPGPGTGSRELAFRGNHVLATRTLQELTASGRLDAEAWKDPAPLIAAIRGAYAAKGYLAARVSIGPIEFADNTATLPIQIDEGPAAQVAEVQLTGVAPERRSGALEAIALAVGAPFPAGADRAARTRLERHYRDLGFRDVRVETTAAAPSQGTDIAVTFAVNEGPLHVISSVEIEGVQSTRPSLVRQAVQLMPGEPAGAAAASTEKRLYELGTFRRAEVRLEPAPAPGPVHGVLPVKAIVSLEEARRFQLRYGLEVSSEYTSALDQRTSALGVAADIRDRNFLGRGMSLGGGLRYEPDLRSARALFSVPTLRRRPIRTNLFLNARGEEQRDDQFTARDDEVNLTFEQRWRVSRAIEYSWGYSSAWHDARLTHATAAETLDFNGILASLNSAAVIDRRDSFFDAKRGWFGSVSLQWGEREFGSDVDYLRTLIRGSYYQPLGPVILASNLRWGRLVPLGGPLTLTMFDLFFNAGGTESVRGYSQDALSAYSFFDAPLGGTKLVVGNVELRAPLFWRLSGVLFADAGNTFTDAQPIRLNELGVGLGFGLRINTPLAPIRIDLGFPRSFGETGVRWHFSIGQMF